jgi:hypothetical protein
MRYAIVEGEGVGGQVLVPSYRYSSIHPRPLSPISTLICILFGVFVRKIIGIHKRLYWCQFHHLRITFYIFKNKWYINIKKKIKFVTLK